MLLCYKFNVYHLIHSSQPHFSNEGVETQEATSFSQGHTAQM
jgi:hypothetical protein